MNKLAFYGYLDFFNDFEDKEYDDDEDLVDSMINGCHMNIDFAIKCSKLEYLSDFTTTINPILIANNREVDYNVWCENIFYDFHYPDFEHALLGKNDILFTFLAVLYNNKEKYDKHKKASEIVYSLALYYNYEYYIKDQEKLLKVYSIDCSKIKDNYFFQYLNTNITLTIFNIYPKPDFDYEDYDFPEYFKEAEYVDIKTNVNLDNVTKYDIVNNFDIAYNLFLKGDTSNLVLSKIIIIDPYKFLDIYKKYKPFLIFCRREFFKSYISDYKKIEPRIEYNICYINMITNTLYHTSADILYKYDNIKIPEYNLYIMSIKLRLKNFTNYLLDLYKKNNNKFIKIMDLENEKYIDPPLEISELPKVDNINILTGDELNPYFLQ